MNELVDKLEYRIDELEEKLSFVLKELKIIQKYSTEEAVVYRITKTIQIISEE